MKKSLVALAALAATAAFAQSSVTLYGIADVYVGSEKVVAGGQAQTVVNSGGLSTSVIGLSVKEDLGAGMQGFVVVENGVNTDTGTSAGVRKSVLGLSGSFGTVALGAQQNPFSQVMENVLDAQTDSVFSSVRGARSGSAIGASLYQTNVNSVRYDTPNFDGFTAAVQVGLGEDKTPALRASRDTSFSVQYANGPLAVALGHQIDETTAGVATRATSTAVGGSYDFSVVKLNLGFTNDKIKGTAGNDKGINVGLTAPIGAFTVVGQLSRNKFTNTANRTSFGLEGRYALSKRTTSYLGLNQTANKNLAPASDKTRVVAVGVRHVF